MPAEMRKCIVCGRKFIARGRGSGRKMTCSAECHAEHARRLSLKRYHIKKLDEEPKPRLCDAGCAGCKYYRPLNGYNTLKVCHFNYDTGHSRGCPPGAGCKVKTFSRAAQNSLLQEAET